MFFLPSSKPFPIGTNLDIRLHIQNLKKIIDTRGRVVRHGEVNGIKGFGLQFQITDPIEKGILKKIIQRSGP